jgi:hypothetical protein
MFDGQIGRGDKATRLASDERRPYCPTGRQPRPPRMGRLPWRKNLGLGQRRLQPRPGSLHSPGGGHRVEHQVKLIAYSASI